MLNFSPHLTNLQILHDFPLATESFQKANHLKDFVFYYFSKFITNITHVFKDFTVSEITDFNRKHDYDIRSIVSSQSLPLEGIIVPIPKGMISSYKNTLDTLLGILTQAHIFTLKSDLQGLIHALETNTVSTCKVSNFSKKEFDEAKGVVGKSFGKTGLMFSTATHVLESKGSVKTVNEDLQKVTSSYYPLVIELNTLLQTLEDRYYKASLSSDDKEIITNCLMVLAYRMSIVAVVMDHIQSLEHAFVKCLTILIKKNS